MAAILSKEDFVRAVDAFGTQTASHFQHPLSDADLIQPFVRRAALFQSNGISLPATVENALVFDFGGIDPNESFMTAPINLSKSRALGKHLSNLLSLSVSSENTVLFYGLRRFVDIRSSQRIGQPVITSQTFVICLSKPVEGALSVHVLTPEGLRPKFASRLSNSISDELVQQARVELNRKTPHLSSMYRGGLRRLLVHSEIGWEEYEYELSDILHSNAATYEVVSLTAKKVASKGPSKAAMISEYFRLGSAGLGEGSFLVPGVSVTPSSSGPPAGITFGPSGQSGSDDNSSGLGTTYEGNIGGTGLLWGPPDSAMSWACSGFATQEDCLGCCQTAEWGAFSLAGSLATGIGIGVSWTIIGAIIFGVVTAGVFAGIYYMYTVCHENCDRRFWKDG